MFNSLRFNTTFRTLHLLLFHLHNKNPFASYLCAFCRIQLVVWADNSLALMSLKTNATQGVI